MNPEWRRYWMLAWSNWESFRLSDDSDEAILGFFTDAALHSPHEHTEPCAKCADTITRMFAVEQNDRAHRAKYEKW